MRVPPETDEERNRRKILEIKRKDILDQKKEAEAKGEKLDDDQLKLPVME